MDITTPIKRALQWSEGMLLTPQHFQQNDIYWHQQLWHRTASLQPYYWGAIDFAVSPSELQVGRVKIERLHAVFPDGLAVQLPDTSQVASFDLGDPQLKWSEQRLLKLYLCVPIRNKAAASANSDIRRYDSLPVETIRDENTGEGDAMVGRLAPRLELLPEDKCSGKYVSFPLLEIRQEAGKRYVLTDFHPPMLRLSASAFLDKRGPQGDLRSLQEKLSRLAGRLREKAKELIGDRRGDDDEAQTYANPDAKYQLYSARMLTAALPAFEILVSSGSAHPFDLYQSLAHLVGQTAAIGADPMPPLLPVYNHDDPMPAFQETMDFIGRRLDRLQVDTETIYFQKLGAESAFSCLLPEDLLADKLHIELKPAAGQSSQSLAEWLGKARIASEELMPTLAERRLPGAQPKAVDPAQIRGVQIRPDAQVFEIANEAIDLGDRRTALIHRGRKLKIQGPHGAEIPANIVLHRTRVRRAGKESAVPAPRAEAFDDGLEPIPELSERAGNESVAGILDDDQGNAHA
ncbi:MAG TPA: type VI secretion system baseplate subunit TssK [Rhodocyclaceae bacterium]|nr:type VI secretion system baseplate subunit TssK [Rhodocyclaceae bacterium]